MFNEVEEEDSVSEVSAREEEDESQLYLSCFLLEIVPFCSSAPVPLPLPCSCNTLAPIRADAAMNQPSCGRKHTDHAEAPPSRRGSLSRWAQLPTRLQREGPLIPAPHHCHPAIGHLLEIDLTHRMYFQVRDLENMGRLSRHATTLTAEWRRSSERASGVSSSESVLLLIFWLGLYFIGPVDFSGGEQ